MSDMEIILAELRDIRNSIADVQAQTTALRLDMEIFRTKVHVGTKFLVGLGGVASTAASACISWVMHHGLRPHN